MIRICTYCEIEGKPAVMGEKPPFEDKSRTDGMCVGHRWLLADPDRERAWFEQWRLALEKKDQVIKELIKGRHA